jgi:hypothetical protein
MANGDRNMNKDQKQALARYKLETAKYNLENSKGTDEEEVNQYIYETALYEYNQTL